MVKKQALVIVMVLLIVTAGIIQMRTQNTKLAKEKSPGDETLGEAIYVNKMNGRFFCTGTS